MESLFQLNSKVMYIYIYEGDEALISSISNRLLVMKWLMKTAIVGDIQKMHSISQSIERRIDDCLTGESLWYASVMYFFLYVASHLHIIILLLFFEEVNLFSFVYVTIFIWRPQMKHEKYAQC